MNKKIPVDFTGTLLFLLWYHVVPHEWGLK